METKEVTIRISGNRLVKCEFGYERTEDGFAWNAKARAESGEWIKMNGGLVSNIAASYAEKAVKDHMADELEAIRSDVLGYPIS